MEAQTFPVPNIVVLAGAPPTPPAIGEDPASAVVPFIPEVYTSDFLPFTLPPTSSYTIDETLNINALYAEPGRINRFHKPVIVIPFFAKRFKYTPEGIFGSIEEIDIRDGSEVGIW